MKDIIFYDIPGKTDESIAWSPNTWSVRYSLNYKGLKYKTEWIEYPDIEDLCKRLGTSATEVKSDGITPHYTLPVIFDPNTNKAIADSLAIADYLDETYTSPEHPRLIPEGSRGLHTVYRDVLAETMWMPLAHVVILATCENLNPRNYAYFRLTREEMFGKKLEDVAPEDTEEGEQRWKDLEAAMTRIAKWFEPTAEKPFLGGDVPCFADAQLAGRLEWARKVLGVGAFSTLRIWAIWGHALGPTLCILLINVVAIAMFTTGTLTKISYIKDGTTKYCVQKLLLPPVLARRINDLLVLILTWIKTADAWRDISQVKGSRPCLSLLLLRDGTLYFGTLLATNIVMMVFLWDHGHSYFPGNGYFYLIQHAVSANLIARFILDLRSAYEPESHLVHSRDGLPSMRFAPAHSPDDTSAVLVRVGVSTWLSSAADDADDGRNEGHGDVTEPFRVEPAEEMSVAEAGSSTAVSTVSDHTQIRSTDVGSSRSTIEVVVGGSCMAGPSNRA
ncbi:hypothetical protein EIP91_010580 [Steccherinum ochraceum]|uniref:GST N-terminal domain-containing protein n=1 Tax=Steccherinum ochraceum TaxID=92696 RepID=A0A4R0RZ90_9APHY|nr:hypothetical protein EIP91_010580 [Steccherinum ochraceum]